MSDTVDEDPSLPLGALTAMVFTVNALIDRGEHLGYEDVAAQIRDESLFPWLLDRFPSVWGPGFLDRVQLADLESKFWSIDNAYSGSKFGVQRNGLCLVVAYVVEVIQEELASRGISR